jgi:signal transduction histidine kinase
MGVELGSRRAGTLPGSPHVPPAALREAVDAFRQLDGADGVWLAVRASRSRDAVIRCVDAESSSALGLRIESRVGAGGGVMAGSPPWRGATSEGDDGGLSPPEREFLIEAGVAAVMVVPLRSKALWTAEPRVEGLVYVGRRDGRPFGEETVTRAVALGEHLARAVRDAQRLEDATKHLTEVAAENVDAAPDHRLDAIAHAIAEDARVTIRSAIGIVFRLDRASGALHALGVDGADLPVVRRGQVLPPGCGSAGPAVARRATFVADHYASGTVRVPPIMSEAIKKLPKFTTLSTPLIFEEEVIGALTVSRQTPVPYEEADHRLIESVAALAAPVLARAQRDSDNARRQQGAAELSRLAGSLTQSLSANAVCDRLVQAVVSLVHGADAAVWDPHGRMAARGTRPAGLLREPPDPRLRRMVELVMSTGDRLWTPDLTNDPRLAETGSSNGDEIGDSRAVLAVPVRIRETPLGVLAVTGETGRAFTEADKDLVQALADQAALAIANARAYHDVEVSRAAVLRHEKLVATGRLAAGLAHELRNPLQNAVGFIAELRDRATAPALRILPEFADFPEFLRQARAELHRAAGIVDRLLDYVRERKPSLESVDVHRIVMEAMALVATGAAKGGKRIEVAAPDTPLRVQGDPVMLMQVVVNILTNALDAIEGPGHVDVGMGLERSESGRGRVVVSVRDTGRGIAAEDLPNVFDLFFTTKEVGKGMGLGLALCQAMIEQHAGAIAIASPGPGQGATVRFELPAEP